MTRFNPALRRLARELDLPREVRAGILLEMAGDLEDLFHRFRDEGLDEDEAARRAEDWVLGSPEVIRRLARLHHGSVEGQLTRLGGRLGRGMDLTLLALGVFPSCVLAAGVVVRLLGGAEIPILLWPILGLAAFMAVLVARAGLRILHRGVEASQELALLLWASAVAPVLGGLGLSLALYFGTRELMAGGLSAAAQTGLVLEWGRAGALLLLGLLMALVGSLSWFVLRTGHSAALVKEVNLLLDGEVPVAQSDDIIPLTRRRRA